MAPLAAICLGTFMLLVDVTIVGVALPQMSRDLHTQLASLQWVVDAYALALAALLLLSGSLRGPFGAGGCSRRPACSPPRPWRRRWRRTPAC